MNKKSKRIAEKNKKTEKNYGFKIAEFLGHGNVIKVTNDNEFELFKFILERVNMVGCLIGLNTFDKWQKLAIANGENPYLFLFEFDNGKGLTWSDDVEASVSWYGKDPLDVNEVYNELFEK